MDVATIIVNYRTAGAAIEAVAGTLRELEGLEDPRIIVVDNASKDGSFERLTAELGAPAFEGRVSVVASGHNGGYGFGINVGVREALRSSSPPPRYIYVINPDASPDPGTLRQLVAFADARPDAGLVGNLVYSPSGERLKAFRFPSILGELESTARIGVLTRWLGRHRVSFDPPGSGPVDWVAGASMLIRREVFSTAGLFDEGFFLYFEEIDFARRVWQNGWKVHFVDEAGVAHVGSLATGMKDETRRMPRYWFESRRRYFVKHHGRLYGAACDAAWLGGHALCAVKLTMQGRRSTLGRHRFGSDFLRYSLENLWKPAPEAEQNAGVPRTSLFAAAAAPADASPPTGAPTREAAEQSEGQADTPPLRILMLAEACNPDWPSLPVVAHNAARAMAARAEVTLVTHVRNRPALERTGAGRASIVYLDTEYVAAPMYRLSRWLRGNEQNAQTLAVAMAWPAQVAFEWEVWRKFKAQLMAGAFDLVHRLTPMSPTLPSPIARVCPVPFVLGPLNGGLPWPPGFDGELRREREYLRYVRGVYKVLPFYASTYARARAIMAAFPHTIADLPTEARARTVDFPEVGVDPALFDWPGERPERETLTFLFAGRLVPYKCADVAIAAFAASDLLRRHRLVVVGDGPEMEGLRAQVTASGLGDVVELLGQRSQTEVGRWMREADVFVFPSVRELGAGVVVEAMACGCVPVVVNHGAPGALVTERTGRRVALGTKAELVANFRAALEAIAGDRPALRGMARAAHERALASYAWDVKARKMLEVYEWALGRRAAPPRFDD